MCGRFTLHSPAALLKSRFGLSQFNFEYIPNYNIAPTQQVIAATSGSDRPSVSMMRWGGLLPPWQTSVSRPLINARFETLTERKTFKHLVDDRRCLILADGFYEWRQEESGKYPVYITLKDGGEPFAFAGLWDGNPEPSCTIITIAANDFFAAHPPPHALNLTAVTGKHVAGDKPSEQYKKPLP